MNFPGNGNSDFILLVQSQLKIVSPVSPLKTVVRNHGVCKENPQPLKIAVDAIQHNDVRSDHQKIARQTRFFFVGLVKEAPRQHETQHFGLATTGRHFDNQPSPVFIKHSGGYGPTAVVADQVILVLVTHDINQPDDRFNCLTLSEEVFKLLNRTIVLLDQMWRLKPPPQQTTAGLRGPDITTVTPFGHLSTKLRHQRWHQLVHRAVSLSLIGRKPSKRWINNHVRRLWEFRMQSHVYFTFAAVIRDSSGSGPTAHKVIAQGNALGMRFEIRQEPQRGGMDLWFMSPFQGSQAVGLVGIHNPTRQ